MKMKRLFQNENAVSPIVATLILVVVAIAGAAAVGTIMGSFSSDVSDEASAEDAAAGASTQLVVAGSTSVTPLAESLKSGFEESNSGIQINIQDNGGDTAGVAAVGMDVIDIGLLSRELTSSEKEKYPDLETHWIGSSAVVIIGGEDVVTKFDSSNFSELTTDDLYNMYNDSSDGSTSAKNLTDASGTSISTVNVYKRSETRSGSEYIFSKFIAEGDGDFISGTKAVEVTGDREMLETIADDPDGLGFVDFRFALEAYEEGIDVNFIGVYDGGDCRLMKGCVEDIEHMNVHIQKSLNGGTVPASVSPYPDPYPMGLLNNMYMVTNGWPSSVESRFINFAQQPASMDLYTDAGYFSLLDVTEQP
ncbi:substrate-binding domain-containing protein [uncultured Methanolobus sp.]|uniref:substrate-binding domain-containing protein n=1 Tax=uncultured Methanolobus sp. TaxID=218300 RepID=UPI002AAAC9BC|nr:substrate-binding domain-containing protein [uncultured Methanolobus sp.]